MGILVNMIVAVFSGGGLRGGTGNSLKRAEQRVRRSGANANKKTGMSVEFAASTVVVLDVALLAGAGGWTPSKRCIRKELNAGPTTRSSIKSCCFLSSLSLSFGAKGKACARRTRPHSSCAIASGCRPAQSQQNCIAHEEPSRGRRARPSRCVILKLACRELLAAKAASGEAATDSRGRSAGDWANDGKGEVGGEDGAGGAAVLGSDEGTC
ncbi:hypothetical protein PCASD_15512 [Puccinia coronata f. sp. avenae]|uniref:Uncharacterized protein n=1 Tax=Puccinia coronata f. sp. avenae TaxID=200324 RepID=A0A2N5UC88_9BASI|nr:hypothetical protein PCASD_15512 [Puccinia coronata f. sp. avenae]